jgi:type III pantothenate kinase
VLAVRVGNRQTVLGLVCDGEVSAGWRVSTADGRTADEWAVLVRGLLGEREHEVAGVVVAATVPSALQQWRSMLAGKTGTLAGVPSLVVEPGVRTGMPVLTDSPRDVGTDRIVNALAALSRYGGPAVVVDFRDTATTFDVLNSQGQYVGGAISPGIEISLEALRSGGAQLRMVELRRPRAVIARNTAEALQSGMVFGVASLVDGIVARMIAELDVAPSSVTVVATGYLAPLVRDECRSLTVHDPDLSLRGLELVYRRNR